MCRKLYSLREVSFLVGLRVFILFSYLFISISLFLIVLLVYLEHSPVTFIFLVPRFLKINAVFYIHILHGYLSVSRVSLKTQSHNLKKKILSSLIIIFDSICLIISTFVSSFCFHHLGQNVESSFLDLCRSLDQSLWGQTNLGSNPSPFKFSCVNLDKLCNQMKPQCPHL